VSRRSSASRRPINPPSNPVGGRFVRVTHKRCPDCELEGRLNTDGRARALGGQLKGATHYVGATKASKTCETCRPYGGNGYIPISPLDPESIDPYARKK
jgi:hypothetical protein